MMQSTQEADTAKNNDENIDEDRFFKDFANLIQEANKYIPDRRGERYWYMPKLQEAIIQDDIPGESIRVQHFYEAGSSPVKQIDVLCFVQPPKRTLPLLVEPEPSRELTSRERKYLFAQKLPVLATGFILTFVFFTDIYRKISQHTGSLKDFIKINPLSVAGFLTSSSYLLSYVYIKLFVPWQQKNLSKELDDFEKLLNKGSYYFDISKAMSRICHKYKYMLWPEFPFNYKLKWRVNILWGRIHGLRSVRDQSSGAAWSYERAYKYASTDSERFIAMRGYLNHLYGAYKLNPRNPSYQGNIAPFLSKIPVNAPEYEELREELIKQIEDCLTRIIKLDKTCFEDFNKMPFDPFCQEAYPDVSAYYYQVAAVLTLVGRKPGNPNHIFYDEFDRLERALMYMLKALHFLRLCEPDKATKYESYVIKFKDYLENLPRHDRPKHGPCFTPQKDAQPNKAWLESQYIKSKPLEPDTRPFWKRAFCIG